MNLESPQSLPPLQLARSITERRYSEENQMTVKLTWPWISSLVLGFHISCIFFIYISSYHIISYHVTSHVCCFLHPLSIVVGTSVSRHVLYHTSGTLYLRTNQRLRLHHKTFPSFLPPQHRADFGLYSIL